MQIKVGRGRDFSQHELAELARYRHRVFVRELGWKLPVDREHPQEERDQFDTELSLYVVARDAARRICGCARLLPTIRPYLLGEVFPALLAASTAPCSGLVWELSRFAARGQDAASARRALDTARLVFAHALLASFQRGATRVVGVLTPSIERVCRMVGAHTYRLGPAQRINGEHVVACAVELAREHALLALAREQPATRDAYAGLAV